MDGRGFLQIIHAAFEPFLLQMGYSMEPPSVSGRFYEVTFRGPVSAVSIYFEPGEDYFNVYIFECVGAKVSDIDDRETTPRLSDLNSRYQRQITRNERANNETFFHQVVANDDSEKLLLKGAKELRLVLPKYLRDRSAKQN